MRRGDETRDESGLPRGHWELRLNCERVQKLKSSTPRCHCHWSEVAMWSHLSRLVGLKMRHRSLGAANWALQGQLTPVIKCWRGTTVGRVGCRVPRGPLGGRDVDDVPHSSPKKFRGSPGLRFCWLLSPCPSVVGLSCPCNTFSAFCTLQIVCQSQRSPCLSPRPLPS